MCDYSLHNVSSRPARVGDQLVTTQFRNSVTRGFSAEGTPSVAVCLRPGTELVFKDEAKSYHPLAWLLPQFHFGNIKEKFARFRQLNMEQPNVHHDALEFANGKIVLLTQLRPGQHAAVLQLPVDLPYTEETVKTGGLLVAR